MTTPSEDDITIAAITKRFNNQRFPRAKKLEEKVMRGETLEEVDLAFLEVVFHDAQDVLKIADRHPEVQELVLKALQFYKDITTKALENEKNK